MFKIIFLLTTLNSTMFYSSNTPLSMGLMLLIQTILIAFMSGMMSFNFWYTYILFLIMVGSMLILFIYMSSLSSNQKFLINKNLMIFNIIMMIMIIILMNNMKFYLFSNSDMMNFMNMELNNNFYLKMSMNKLYNKPNIQMMFLLINYLMLTLFVVVKITNINLGPLRKN